MIRASVFPLNCAAPTWPGESASTEQVTEWIEHVWADDPRAEAISHASPLLASAVREVVAGTARPSRARRTGRSLARYLLRMRYRATPFGLFAGPAVAHTGQEAHVHWGHADRAFAHASAAWLHEITTAFERDPAVLHYLTVVADPGHIVRGSRITVLNQPGSEGPTDTSLRRTRAGEAALKLARHPIPAHVLMAKLGIEHPEAPKAAIEDMVRNLVAHRVLLTELRAPMTCPDALGYLVTRLEESGTDVPAVTRLRSIQGLLEQHDRAPAEEQPKLREQVTAAMSTLTGVTDRTLMVNIRPDADIILPQHVAREAERALDLMTRITPYPHGSAAWTDYRSRFLERYSMGTVVPVRELTDPDTGLGFPVGYRGTVLPRPVLATSPRDEHLLRLAQDAALTDQREIVLTEEDIDALSLGEPTAVPAHVELCFSVLAQSTRALTEGRFTLSTVGLSLAAGTLTGRFLPMLDPADQARMAAEYNALPTLTEDAVRVQLSSPPLKGQTYNVARAPLTAPEALAIGEYNPDATIELDDLGVVADAGRLYLVSLSTGRCLEPSVMSAVELSTATHPLVRFLCEVHRSHAAILAPFAWGAAATLPFLPEVRFGRTILSAACWRLRARDLDDPECWEQDFINWRIQYGVPRAVYVGSSDQQLRLDLDLSAHRDLLRAELDHHRVLSLHEAPEESAYGWIGRAHEVTMCFAAAQTATPPPTRYAVARRDAGRLPGATDDAYLKVYGSEARAPEVLTTHLPRLLDELETSPEAWFIRYADPEPHLRIRLPLPSPNAFGDAARTVAEWADELRDEGLIQRVQWDTYLPETGRYGSGAELAVAERYFAADTAAALAQMRLGLSPELRPAITAGSYVDIATGFLGSPAAGHSWLVQHLLRSDGVTAPRHTQALVLRLTESADAGPALTGLPGGDTVRDAWQRRRDALARYHQALDAAGLDPSGVLPSLLHMHHNRVAGIDRDAEALCRRMARAAALSWSVRHKGAER
ncbi:bacteriocin biosynthesis protein [Streptomyces sp. YC537]|uniref:Bacteriocin biosynthesis protein n=2 Tax=Streptomyces boluensis TaxID=1775135 RepID=A0A964XKK9_9ACTN|nr:bacteriocin biosynthesis protein [Streptomyces boluensis]